MKAISAQHWANYLAWVLDAIALLALAGTTEIHPAVFGLVLTVLVLSRFSRLRMGDRVTTVLFALTLVGTLVGWLIFKVHPILAAAHGAPLLHGFLWLSRKGGQYRGWRLGISFIDLILAASLSADFYLSILIFLFVILSSVMLSCSFLERELGLRSPATLSDPMPDAFVRNSIGLSFVILLTSLIIFVILPRSKPGGGTDMGTSQVGYTEEVTLSDWTRLSGNGGGATALRLYPPPGLDLLTEIFLGLLKGKSLVSFDGQRWGTINERATYKGISLHSDRPNRIIVEAVREPIGSKVLPVPYGTDDVTILNGGSALRARRSASGDWADFEGIEKRVRYQFEFQPAFIKKSAPAPELTPSAAHLEVPESFKTGRIIKLSQAIFKGAKRTDEKVQRLRLHFSKNGFSGATADNYDASKDIRTPTRLSALETFLFIDQKGNCELFASASALLLRMVDVPTRLVAGFRLSRAPIAGVLNVRSGDAHAWLEFWHADRGWEPFDPTPRAIRPPAAFEYFEEIYGLMSAYWHRYILTYDSSTQLSFFTSALRRYMTELEETPYSSKEKESLLSGSKLFQKKHLLGIAATLVVLGLILLKLRLLPGMGGFSRKSSREGPEDLKRIRRRLERALSKTSSPPHRAAGDLDHWAKLYEELRFGPEPRSNESLARLYDITYRIEKNLRAG